MNIYLEGFTCVEDMLKAYQIEEKDLKGMEVLYASYETGCYDGQSIVLLKKDDKFFIVDASHCSCYGLENQWDPIETSEAVLKKELEGKSHYRYHDFASFIEFCNKYFNWMPK